MKRLLALLLIAPLGACVRGDIDVPPSGPGRQQALCAISFSQWLGINSHDVEVVSRGVADGGNAVIGLRSASPAVTGTCEITPRYAIASVSMD